MKRLLSVLALTIMVSACGPAPTQSPDPYPSAYPSAAPSVAPDALAQLIGQESLSPEERRIRDNLARDIKLDFPIKIAVLFYNASQLNPSDQQKIFDGLKTTFKDSQMVRETIQIPANIVSSLSMDFMRQLGSRFKADILLVVSGRHEFGRSPSQKLGFFDMFSDTTFYESNVQLTGLAIDIYTGAYLNPLSTATQAGPKSMSPSDTNFSGSTYALKKEAEDTAWTRLGKDFIDMLTEVKRESDNLPPRPEEPQTTASPSPQPTPNPAP